MLLLVLAMGALAAAGTVAGDLPAAAGDIALAIAAPGAGAGDVGDLTSMCHGGLRSHPWALLILRC